MQNNEPTNGTGKNMSHGRQANDPENDSGLIESAIAKACAACAETQRLLALPYLTVEQVAMVYPVSRSLLEKMRMERTGPEFVQVKDKGAVVYTHKAMQNWLNRHRQRVL